MKKAICIILVCASCLLLLCGCVSRSDVIGVWEKVDDYNLPYTYYFKDGTGNNYWKGFGRADKNWSHINHFTWKIEGEYLVIYSDGSVSHKYTVSGDQLLDGQGKIVAKKISDDPTKDLFE